MAKARGLSLAVRQTAAGWRQVLPAVPGPRLLSEPNRNAPASEPKQWRRCSDYFRATPPDLSQHCRHFTSRPPTRVDLVALNRNQSIHGSSPDLETQPRGDCGVPRPRIALSSLTASMHDFPAGLFNGQNLNQASCDLHLLNLVGPKPRGRGRGCLASRLPGKGAVPPQLASQVLRRPSAH